MADRTCRFWREEDGHGALAYALVTGMFSMLVFRPDLVAAVVYRLADLFSLFVSQVESVF